MSNNNTKTSATPGRADRKLYCVYPKWKMLLRPSRKTFGPSDNGFLQDVEVRKSLVLDFEMNNIPAKITTKLHGRTVKNFPVTRSMGVANYDAQFDGWIENGMVQEKDREELWRRACKGPEFGVTYGTKEHVPNLRYGPAGRDSVEQSSGDAIDFDAFQAATAGG